MGPSIPSRATAAAKRCMRMRCGPARRPGWWILGGSRQSNSRRGAACAGPTLPATISAFA
jgi:hypothetical protein